MKGKSIKLAKIILDAGTQIRAGLNDDAVKDYAEAMGDATNTFPPIIVFETEPDKFLLADGFHRVAAANLRGFLDILAEVRKGTRAEALKCALSANTTHGLRLTNADKRKSVDLALKEWPDVSDAEIARMCGVSHPFVGTIRPKSQVVTVTTSTPPAPPKKRIGKDGKSYPATKAKTPGATPPAPSGPPFKAASAKSAGSVPVAATDRTGLSIPPAILPLWNRAEKGQELLSYISKVRTELKKAQEVGLLEFAEVNFSSALSHLDQAYADIKVVKPHAVCYSCQGKVTEDCAACKGRGYVSEFNWDHFAPIEVKEMRAKLVAPEPEPEEAEV
jgi:hypothetical protein